MRRQEVNKTKKCLIKSAYAIKVFLTLCGLSGIGLMIYDMQNRRECDVHYFSTYVAFCTSMITMLGAVGKFGYEIKNNINCFKNIFDGCSDVIKKEISNITDGSNTEYRSRSSSDNHIVNISDIGNPFLDHNSSGNPFEDTPFSGRIFNNKVRSKESNNPFIDSDYNTMDPGIR